MNKSIICISLIFISFYSIAQVNLDLERRVLSIEVQNQPANEILLDIGTRYGFSISYNTDFIKKVPLTIKSDTITLKEVIDSLFLKDDLKLRLIGNQLVVYEPNHKTPNIDHCQNIISGIIIDNFTQQPIVRASIKELTTGQLTVTNRDGKFLLKIPCDVNKTQLEISAIGYRSKYLAQSINEEISPIILEGDYIPLKEVFILSLQADKLVEEVLQNICNNYQDQATQSISFFREAILKNNKMVALSEAVVDVYNYPYNIAGRKDRVQLVKGRKFIDHQNIDTIDFKLKGSLRSCFELDIVKHQPFFFNINTYKDAYTYSFNTVKEFNGRNIYVINFKSLNTTQELPYQGKMYIDNELKTLVAIEFELSKKSLRKTEDHFVFKKSKNLKTNLQKATYYVQYTDVDGKLAMNYVAFKSTFKVKKKKSIFSAKYETMTEYVVNNFQLENVNKIRNKDTFAADKIFLEELIEYNDEYWQGINFLPLDKPLLESSEELQKIFTSNH